MNNIWQTLKSSNQPIVLYGMGNGATKIINKCNSENIKISDIFASDEYARGQIFDGFEVLTFDKIKEKYTNCIILLCFAVFEETLLKKIYDMSKIYTVLAPDVPLVSGEVFTDEVALKYKDEIEKARSLLADEKSVEVFDSTIAYKLSGDISILRDIETSRDEVFENIYHSKEKSTTDELYIDCGAYDGDTIEEFIKHYPRYKEIFAFEPDMRNYKKLQATIKDKNLHNINAINGGIWSEKGTLVFDGRGSRSSALLKYAPPKENKRRGAKEYEIPVYSIDQLNLQPTHIKMDIEGAEYEGLNGAKNTMQNYKPRLQISAYHKSEDFFKLILQIHEINPLYKIHLRHHPYIPAWETNIYCI